MKRSEKNRDRSRGHRLLSRRRTHQESEGREARPKQSRPPEEPSPPEKGFVIGPVEGGSDISLDPAKYLGGG
jgi:hypothetical protein